MKIIQLLYYKLVKITFFTYYEKIFSNNPAITININDLWQKY